MCGLCGLIGFDARVVPPEVERRMLESLNHRGADDRGAYRARTGDAEVFSC